MNNGGGGVCFVQLLNAPVQNMEFFSPLVFPRDLTMAEMGHVFPQGQMPNAAYFLPKELSPNQVPGSRNEGIRHCSGEGEGSGWGGWGEEV